MSEQEPKRKTLSRRVFIRKGGTLSAGVALAPFILDLTGCSSDAPGAAPGAAGSTSSMPATELAGVGGLPPTTAAGVGSPSAAGGGGQISSNGGAGNPASAQAGSGGQVAQNQAGQPGTAGQPSQAGAGGEAGSAGNPSTSTGSAIAAGSVLLGLYNGDGAAAVTAAAKKLDFSWLKAGDTVLIKVATNSGYKHPTTTSPTGVHAVVKELKARGAGKVIVADQAGVEHVRSTSTGRVSSTLDQWKMNGMDVVSPDADMYFFDDQPFDTGYFSASLPPNNHWPRGMYIPSIIKQADHVIYMPRIGTHILAGLTLSHKSAIGWLRDDSRHDLHNDAMFFYEKYTEVNYTQEIVAKYRMTITVSEAILLHGGPDTGTNYKLSPVMVTASTRMANHDAVAASVLVTLNASVTQVDPGTMTYSAASAPQNNVFFANGAGIPTAAAGPWKSGSSQTMYTAHPFEMGISKDRAISRGWELSGGKPTKISVVLDGEALDASLKSGITTHGEGLYDFG